MADQTSATLVNDDVQDLEVNDQATLDKVIAAETAKMSKSPKGEDSQSQADLVNKAEDKPKDEGVDYRTKFSEIKKAHDQKAQKLKELEAQIKQAEESKAFQSMDYDQKLEHMNKKLEERDLLLSQLQEMIQQQDVITAQKADEMAIQDFISKDTDLSVAPQLQTLFKMIANSDELVPAEIAGDKEVRWREVPLEDIKRVYFAPMLEKMTGTRVRTKDRALSSTSSTVDDEFTEAQIAAMSPAEYERNKPKILKKFGITY